MRAFLVHIAANRPRLRWPSVLFFSEQFCFLKSCPSFFFILKLAEMFCFFFVCVMFWHIYSSGRTERVRWPFFYFCSLRKTKGEILKYEIMVTGTGTVFVFFWLAQFKRRDKKKFFCVFCFSFQNLWSPYPRYKKNNIFREKFGKKSTKLHCAKVRKIIG